MNIIDTSKKMFKDQSFTLYEIDTFIEILTKTDDFYYNDDESFLTDGEYDFLRRYAEKLAPGHVYFTGVGSDIRGGKIKLPYTMGSLDQIYEGEMPDWVKKHNLEEELIVLTDKLDGTSAMLIYDKTGGLQIAYSRGNGEEGADITRHISKLRSVPQTLLKDNDSVVVRGEVIIEISTFPYLCEQVKRKSGKPYKNPRNAVAGFMNSKTVDKVVYSFIKFVAYQIVGGTGSKEEQLRQLQDMGFEVPYSLAIRGKNATDENLTNHLNLRRQDSVYEIDGLVGDVNAEAKRKEMNPTRDTLNPAYAIKYKVTAADNIATPTVIGVDWNISKHGYLKPRVNIEPVEMGGVTIEWATGFNAAFIFTNGIGKGAVIEITRSGDVIPFIQRVITPAVPEMPMQFDWDWSVNDAGEKVDAVLKNPENFGEVAVKQIIDFFDKIDAPMLKEGNVQKLYDADYKTIASIIKAACDDLVNVLGENGNKAYDGLRDKLTDIPLYKIMGAHSTYRGIGIRKIKKIQNAWGRDGLYACNSPEDIATVDGFDTKTSILAVNAIDDFKDFFAEVYEFITIAEEEKSTDSTLAGEKVCMTGFRDKELAAKIESLGADVQSGVSGKTTILVAKDPKSTSGKIKKARDAGVKIMGIDEFKEFIDM